VTPSFPPLSLVIPLYNEEENVAELYRQVHAVAAEWPSSVEVIYVDDGSRDGTWERLRELYEAHLAAGHADRMVVVRFRRNYGQTAALSAGFARARGDVIVTLDGDLQNDPADIPAVVAKLEEGYDVVSGWRKKRQDALWSRKVPSWIANRLISRITGVSLHDYGCSLKAYRREIVENIQLYGEMHRFIPAIASWVGASVTEMEVHHRPRQAGRSKYGLWRTFKVLLDLITVKFLGDYSTKPLHVFGGGALVLLTCGVLVVLWLIYDKLAHAKSIVESPLLLLSVLFVILGAQSLMLGLLAEIGVRTYFESQGKTPYIVREVLEGSRGN
jgi:glycosyltransferase involved in cell wall biosynthesis